MTGPDYLIAITSLGRPVVVVQKTLTMLRRGKVDPHQVTLFLGGNDGEVAAYQEQLYAWNEKWARTVRVERVPKGRAASRNTVAAYYPAGTPFVSLDDDIEDLQMRVSSKEARSITDLDGFFQQTFQRAFDNGVGLWGVYPMLNPFYMQPTASFDLRLVAGGVFGCRAPDMRVFLDYKEDVERTLLYYLRDGKVMRLNYVAFKTGMYKGAGGMNEDRTRARERAAVDYLVKTYPGLVQRHYHTRSSPYPEVKLQDNRKKKVHGGSKPPAPAKAL